MVDSKDSLITFIKNTLGCRCPEEVFENIDVKFIRPIENVGEFARVVVGNTLLVYVYCDGQLGDVISSIEQTTNKGRDDRNKNKYNRFRLVLPDNFSFNGVDFTTSILRLFLAKRRCRLARTRQDARRT